MALECAAGTLIMGRGNILWKGNVLGMCRGNTNNGTREPHPVWGFKNLKTERCGGKGLGRKVNGKGKLSIVFEMSLQVGCSRKHNIIPGSLTQSRNTNNRTREHSV